MSAEINYLKLDKDLADDALSSIKYVFEEAFGIKVTKTSQKICGQHHSKADLSGIVSLAQSEVEGSMVLSFKKGSLEHILREIYHIDVEFNENTIRQGVGEISNMLFGQFKLRLNERGYQFKMAAPSVVAGSNHIVSLSNDSHCIVFSLTFADESFELSINLPYG